MADRGKVYREGDLSGLCGLELRLGGTGAFSAASASLRSTCDLRLGETCATGKAVRYPSAVVSALYMESMLSEVLWSLKDNVPGGSIGEELGAKKLSESPLFCGPPTLQFLMTGAMMRSVFSRIPAFARPAACDELGSVRIPRDAYLARRRWSRQRHATRKAGFHAPPPPTMRSPYLQGSAR